MTETGTTAATVQTLLAPDPRAAPPTAASAIGGPVAGIQTMPASTETKADAPAVKSPVADQKTQEAAKAPATKPGLLSDDAPPEAAKADVKTSEPAKADAPAVDLTYTLDAPKDTKLATTEVKALEDFAKANGMSKEQAAKLLDHRHTVLEQEVARTADAWRAETEADPEIGGTKLAQSLAHAKAALVQFATPAERKAIASSPFANNALFIRIMARAGAGLHTEDTVHANGGTGVRAYPTTPEAAKTALYGDLKS